MSRSSFKAHAVDASGAVLTSASVTVRDQSGVVISPSALFTAYSGAGTHASNPFTATGGLISFYVEGSQVVTVSAVSGGTSQTWSNVVLNELIEPSDFATSAQGTKADSATQPADLGTAAATDSTDYATSAQGTLADSALQAADLGTAAAADLTTSDTDTTAGRVLKTDSVAMGRSGYEQTTSIENINFPAPMVRLGNGSNPVGLPFAVGAGDVLQSFRWDSNARMQMIYRRSTSSGANPARIAINSTSNGTNWYSDELWTTGNLTKGTNPTDVPTNADLGTAAAADLTTSITDTTAGRALKVGDWGIGTGNGPTITDFNSYYDAGFYRGAGGSAANASINIDRYLPSIVASRNGDRSIFTWGGDANGLVSASIYYRTAAGANYSAQLWTTDNYQPETSFGLGVVRLMKNVSGGTLADQATVSGSNLNLVLLDSSGNLFAASGVTVAGTWKNITGRFVESNYTSYFVRIA